MPFFRYTVKNADGRTVTETAEAASASALAASLRAAGMAVLRMREISEREAADEGLPPRWHPSWLLRMAPFDAELGYRQLATMLRGGVSILQALRMAAEQARRPRAARTWRRIASAVARGGSLSEAMRARGRPFTEYAVQLAAVGEHSGELDRALERAADHQSAHRELLLSLTNALLYPCIAMLAAIGVSVFLVVSVLPKIEAFLAAGGAELPELTRSMLDLSAWLRDRGPALLLGLGGAAVLFAAWRRTPTGRDLTGAAALRLPMVGGIVRTAGTAVLARGFSVLLDSGLPLLDALAVSAGLLGNRRQARRVGEARRAVLRGEPLSVALARSRAFTPMLAHMTAVAETTGTFGATLGEVADFHERRLRAALRRLSILVEPLVLLLAAGLVGFVYVAFFLALFAVSG